MESVYTVAYSMKPASIVTHSQRNIRKNDTQTGVGEKLLIFSKRCFPKWTKNL